MNIVFPIPAPAQVETWAPTWAASLRTCGLRAAFDRDRDFRPFRRPTTFSALGNAAHRLTERAWKGAFNDAQSDLDAVLALSWDEEIAKEAEKLDQAWAPAQPPPVTEWPGYALTRRRTLRRVREEVGRYIEATDAGAPRGGASQALVEHELKGEGGVGLVGTPDRVVRVGGGLRVVDLKTGLHLNEMSADHRRQLHLYAFLVEQHYGEWPTEIAVVAAGGREFVEPLDPEVAQAAAKELEVSVEEFNTAVDAGCDAMLALARPSDEACGYCPYRPCCGAFWNEDTPSLHERTVLGVLQSKSLNSAIVAAVAPKGLGGQSVTIVEMPPLHLATGETFSAVDLDSTSAPTTFRARRSSRFWQAV